VNSVPAPDLRGLSDEEIWEQLHSGMVDSDLHKQCVLTLQLRNLQRQTQATNALVTATDQLVTATDQLGTFTKRLVMATWALVFMTLLLAVVTILQLFMR
jgi:hypothetical protein